jgi:hypothetical protein
MVLDFIILTIAIFTSLLFLMSTIADIVSSGGFVVSEAEQKQKDSCRLSTQFLQVLTQSARNILYQSSLQIFMKSARQLRHNRKSVGG